MANEVYPVGRGFVLVDVEASYGAGAAAMTADDVVYVEDVSMDQVTDMITREGVSPERPGFRPVAGMEHASLSVSTECRPKVQTAPLDDADAPDIDKLLRAAGWAREDDDANVTQTYLSTTYASESAEVQMFEINDANNSQTLWDFLGVRLDWSFSWNAGERWMWTFEGNGQSVQRIDTGASWEDTVTGIGGSINYGSDEPLVAKAVSGNGLVELDGNVVFGGGVLGAPTHELGVLSLSASGNMGVSEHEAATAEGALGRVLMVPAGPITLECVVEQTNSGAGFDPYILRNAMTPIEVNYTLTQTGTGGSLVTARITAYALITGISLADSNGRKTWSLSLECVYPESASDGGTTTEVGEDPSQAFETGASDIGLANAPLAGLARLGTMAIQFITV